MLGVVGVGADGGEWDGEREGRGRQMNSTRWKNRQAPFIAR